MADKRAAGGKPSVISGSSDLLLGTSIGRRLSRRILLLSIITVIVMLGTMYLGVGSVLNASSRGLLTARGEAEQIFTRFLEGIFQDLRATSDALAVGDDPDALFRQALDRQTAYVDIRLIAPRGEVLASRRRSGVAPASVATQPWLTTMVVGEIYFGSVDYEEYGAPIVAIAVPVEDEAGNFYASLVAQVDLTALWDIVAGFNVGDEGHVYVSSWSGMVILHQDLDFVQKKISGDPNTGELFPMPNPREIAEEDYMFYRGHRDEWVFASAAPIIPDVTHWYVVVERPVAEIFRPLITEGVIILILFIGIVGGVLDILNFTRRRIVYPLRVLHKNVLALGEGDLERRIPLEIDDEFGVLAATLNTLASQLQEIINTLEHRIAERTRGLRAAADISRATTTVLDPDELQRETVDLIRERFDLYYVGLFLVDETEAYAVLRAGTGEAGRKMLESDHRLRVGGATMIGQCVSTGEGRIALDVGEEASRFDNPLLPETHSEMALPLQARGRIIGALSVQSKEIAAFDEADIAVMQTMADQVAVAIDNARLFTESQAALEEMEEIQRRYTEQAWGAFTRKRAIKGYEQTATGLRPLDEAAHQNEIQTVFSALRTGEPSARSLVFGEGGERSSQIASKILAPILQRERPIGVLGCEAHAEGRRWSKDQVALVETIAEQFAIAAENLRLLDETQRRAAREQAVTEVTAKIRAEVEIEAMLQEALTELGQVLGADRGLAHLALGEESLLEEEETERPASGPVSEEDGAGLQAQQDGNGNENGNENG